LDRFLINRIQLR